VDRRRSLPWPPCGGRFDFALVAERPPRLPRPHPTPVPPAAGSAAQVPDGLAPANARPCSRKQATEGARPLQAAWGMLRPRQVRRGPHQPQRPSAGPMTRRRSFQGESPEEMNDARAPGRGLIQRRPHRRSTGQTGAAPRGSFIRLRKPADARAVSNPCRGRLRRPLSDPPFRLSRARRELAGRESSSTRCSQTPTTPTPTIGPWPERSQEGAEMGVDPIASSGWPSTPSRLARARSWGAETSRQAVILPAVFRGGGWTGELRADR
jgi:hypothetical protein